MAAPFDPDAPEVQPLFRVILSLRDLPECKAFFMDLCTEGDLRHMADRWLLVRLVDEDDLSYLRNRAAEASGNRDDHPRTALVDTCIGRVSS